MRVLPAVDLREGACVQLVGGSYDHERVRLGDPVAVARSWARLGFRRLHVVDLDAATGRGSNQTMLEAILADRALETQVGGGVRDGSGIDRLVAAGAARVVVGTRALEDPEWLAAMAERHPNTLVVAADVRERSVVTRGWSFTLGREVTDALEDLNPLPLAGVLVTAVHREGSLAGPDLGLIEEVAERSRLPLCVSGGIATMEELRSLDRLGIAEAIVGLALYTGRLDPRAVAEEYA